MQFFCFWRTSVEISLVGGIARQGLSPFESMGTLAHEIRSDYEGFTALCARIADDDIGFKGKVR